jgi:hypothetical protein
MNINELIEQAKSAGVVTTMSVPVSDVPDSERVDGFDWDAYPHMAELSF